MALNENYMVPLVTLLDIPGVIAGSFDKNPRCLFTFLGLIDVWCYYATGTHGMAGVIEENSRFLEILVGKVCRKWVL